MEVGKLGKEHSILLRGVELRAPFRPVNVLSFKHSSTDVKWEAGCITTNLVLRGEI